MLDISSAAEIDMYITRKQILKDYELDRFDSLKYVAYWRQYIIFCIGMYSYYHIRK